MLIKASSAAPGCKLPDLPVAAFYVALYCFLLSLLAADLLSKGASHQLQ
jgi:hypothetical protein